jgi:two-component system response regulator
LGRRQGGRGRLLLFYAEEMKEVIDILLVEDNEDDAKLTLATLQKHVTEKIHHCHDGVEALEFLLSEGREVEPRLILLDLNLPRLSGIEVLERLRKDPRTEQIPVVVLTSSSRKADLDASYAAGANSYLVKAVNYRDFARDVQQLGAYWLGMNRS